MRRHRLGIALCAAGLAACAEHEVVDDVAAPPQPIAAPVARPPATPAPMAPVVTADGPPVSGWLQDFAGARFPVDPGHCYAVAFESRPTSRPLPVYPLFRLTTPGERREERGEALATRSSAQSGLFCPTHPGVLELYFVSDAAGNPTRRAGDGPLLAQLFRAPPLVRNQVVATAPLDPNRYTLPIPPIVPGAATTTTTTAPRRPVAQPPQPAPRSYEPVYGGEDCSRTCFLAKNRCSGRCSDGGASGSEFRNWCERECSHQQDECRSSCLR